MELYTDKKFALWIERLYLGAKYWLWIDNKELRAKNTENMDQKQKICSLDRKIVLRIQILV